MIDNQPVLQEIEILIKTMELSREKYFSNQFVFIPS